MSTQNTLPPRGQLPTKKVIMTIDDIRNLHIEDFNYELPDERIAKHPLADREQCKLLLYGNHSLKGEYRFADVPRLLPHASMLVYNNTRVINARLRFRKPNNGAWIEIFCLEPFEPRDYAQAFATTGSCRWTCLIGNAKRWKNEPLHMPLAIGDQQITLTAMRGERCGNAFIVGFSWDGDDITFASVLEDVGEIPIPPYLNRATEPSDSRDYQTVYSHIDGSVAAPTAGLHFTDSVLAECDRNDALPDWRNPEFSLKARYAAVSGPKGRPFKEQFIYDFRAFGPVRAMLHFLSLNLKVLFPMRY